MLRTLMLRRYCLIYFLLLLAASPLRAQDADALLKKVRAKMDQVRDYKAQGTLKTDVSFLKIPSSKVQVLYKNPDKFRIQKEGGVSLLPKGGISVNLNAMLATGTFMAVSAGTATVQGQVLQVIKLLPVQESGDVVLSTLYIDDKALLIRRTVTTTRDNGTYEMNMQYGRYANVGLPDKVLVSFDTRDYKLPKGVTFEYDAGNTAPPKGGASGKGTVEITYTSYELNPGLTDAAFRQEKASR
jgi:outer membrane lipoprotein-sorting protein